MKSITGTWFECTIKYEQMQENGISKKKIEKYAMDALSFTEAEARIISEMSPFITGEYEIKKIDRSAYSEVFFSDDAKAFKWFNVKVIYITIDEKSAKEKRTNTSYLINSDTPDNAIKAMRSVLSQSMSDFEISSSVDTKIIEVFTHNS